jgi:hypothetical protein
VSAGRRELQRVGDQVVENLAEPRAVGAQLAHSHHADVEIECDALLGGGRSRGVDGLPHELLDIGQSGLECDLAGLHLRYEEQVAEQSQQAIGVSFDDRHELVLRTCELACLPFAEELEVAADRGQRGP